jgi:SAM-dependent methyltransferase
MDASLVDPYEVYAYPGLTIPYTAPAHIALCARWSHGLAPSLERFRLVELGCGDGGNLLPLAFYHPESLFVGIDNSRAAVDRALDAANRLGLRNLRLVCGDVRGLAPVPFGTFDYVIAHGLYSWVPDDARAAILAFCRDTLAPGGLAYISYNAQPGWSTRRLVRETLRRSRSVREAAVREKATKAIELAARLLEDVPSSGFASTVVLADELARVRDSQPFYVFHEYLAATNDGFWLGDFVEHARHHDLAYVVDAQFCRWQGYVPPELRRPIAERHLDPIEEEETVDLFGHRYFRASILCRSDVVSAPTSRQELVEEAHIAGSLRLQSETLDLTEGAVERFISTVGSEVTLDSSITKAAVALLSSNWPFGIRLDRLFLESSSLLTAHDCPVLLDAQRQLVDGITALFEAGQVDLRVHEPVYSSEIAEHPIAHALARWEAAHREALTTPHHLPLAFHASALELIRSLDGSRSRADLARMFAPDLVEATLPVLARWGLLDERTGPAGS